MEGGSNLDYQIQKAGIMTVNLEELRKRIDNLSEKDVIRVWEFVSLLLAKDDDDLTDEDKVDIGLAQEDGNIAFNKKVTVEDLFGSLKIKDELKGLSFEEERERMYQAVADNYRKKFEE